MGTLHRVRATARHGESLALYLRAEDRREVASLGWTDAQLAITKSIEISTSAWAALDGAGNTVIIAGVGESPLLGVGIPWMMAAKDVRRYKHWVVRHTKEIVAEMHAKYPMLINYCDSRNEVHKRWLQYAGFSFFSETHALAGDGTKFLGFAKHLNV